MQSPLLAEYRIPSATASWPDRALDGRVTCSLRRPARRRRPPSGRPVASSRVSVTSDSRRWDATADHHGATGARRLQQPLPLASLRDQRPPRRPDRMTSPPARRLWSGRSLTSSGLTMAVWSLQAPSSLNPLRILGCHRHASDTACDGLGATMCCKVQPASPSSALQIVPPRN